MKYYLSTILMGLILLSCSGDDDSNNNILIGATFDYLFFQTQQECLDAQPDPNFFINCHQELSFIDSNTARIVLTDIIYNVDYVIFANMVIIRSSSNTFEFSNDITFEILNDYSLRKTDDGTIWNRRIGNSIWD